MGVGNADAGIRDAQNRPPGAFADRCRDAAAGNVIFDRVVEQIIDHFLEQLLHAHNFRMLSGQRQRHRLSRGDRGEPLETLRAKIIEIDRRALELRAVFVQSGKLDDVVNQTDQPQALLIDIARKLRDFLRRHQALLHQLCKAGDGGERRFQLVRHVRGKLAAQALSLLALGDVHEQNHRACHLPGGDDGICKHLPARLVDG